MAAQEKTLDQLEMDVDRAIAACDGDVRATIKSLIMTNDLLWSQIKTHTTAVASGYARGKVWKPRNQ